MRRRRGRPCLEHMAMSSGFGVADERGLRVAGYLTKRTEEVVHEGVSGALAMGGRVGRVHGISRRQRGGGGVMAVSCLRRRRRRK